MASGIKLLKMATAEEFYTAMMSCTMTEKEMAHEFGVSRPTVTRWITKKNFPHPAMWDSMMLTFARYKK